MKKQPKKKRPIEELTQPWRLQHDEEEGCHRILIGEAFKFPACHASHLEIAYEHCLFPEDGQQFEEAAFIARLMASSPELFRALQTLISNPIIVGMRARIRDEAHGRKEDCPILLANRLLDQVKGGLE